MSDFDAARREIRIAAPREQVWAALTEPAELNRWQTRQAQVDLRVGGRIWLDYGEIQEDAVIVELEPPERLVYADRDGVQTAWTLRAEGDATVLVLELTGFRPDDSGQLYREGATFSFGRLMANLKSVLEAGRDLRPTFWRIRVGLTYISVQPRHRERTGGVQAGVLVLNVGAGSPAAAAGVERYDVIVAANGRPVHSYQELSELIYSLAPGDRLQLTLLRQGQERQATVVVGEVPAA